MTPFIALKKYAPAGSRTRGTSMGGVYVTATLLAHLHRLAFQEMGALSCKRMSPNINKCISRELNPGHIDGNDVFYH